MLAPTAASASCIRKTFGDTHEPMRNRWPYLESLEVNIMRRIALEWLHLPHQPRIPMVKTSFWLGPSRQRPTGVRGPEQVGGRYLEDPSKPKRSHCSFVRMDHPRAIRDKDIFRLTLATDGHGSLVRCRTLPRHQTYYRNGGAQEPPRSIVGTSEGATHESPELALRRGLWVEASGTPVAGPTHTRDSLARTAASAYDVHVLPADVHQVLEHGAALLCRPLTTWLPGPDGLGGDRA